MRLHMQTLQTTRLQALQAIIDGSLRRQVRGQLRTARSRSSEQSAPSPTLRTAQDVNVRCANASIKHFEQMTSLQNARMTTAQSGGGVKFALYDERGAYLGEYTPNEAHKRGFITRQEVRA